MSSSKMNKKINPQQKYNYPRSLSSQKNNKNNIKIQARFEIHAKLKIHRHYLNWY